MNFKLDIKANRIDYFSQHWYEVEGLPNKLPSVTLINDVLSKGYGYNEWLKNVGNNSDYILRQAQESGSRIHNAIESLLLGNKVSAVDPMTNKEYDLKEWKKICQWFEWFSKLKIKPLYIEQLVYSKEWGVAGTADLICEIEGETWLLDWKTGNDIYVTAEIQVAAYMRMFNEMMKENKIQRGAVVHVGARNKTFKDMNGPGIQFVEVDYNTNVLQFNRNIESFRFMNGEIKAPSDQYPLTLKLGE